MLALAQRYLRQKTGAYVARDLSVDFRDVPGLGQAITRTIARQPIAFEIEGTIGVSACRICMQTLGPMTWLRGELPRPRLTLPS